MCKDDSCDAIHCPQCGGHKLGWYEPGLCSQCEAETSIPVVPVSADVLNRRARREARAVHAMRKLVRAGAVYWTGRKMNARQLRRFRHWRRIARRNRYFFNPDNLWPEIK